MTDDMPKLFRRLVITEKVITGLLSGKSDLTLVEKKLNTLQELIANLPPGRPDLDEQWSKKLVHLWTVFATKGSDAEDATSSGSIRSSASSLPSPKPDAPKKSAYVFPPSPPHSEVLLSFDEAPRSISPVKPKPKLPASPRKISSPPPLLIDFSTPSVTPNPKPVLTRPSSSFPTLETFSFFKYPNLLVDQARLMIKEAFEKVPPIENVNDIQAIRAYFRLVIKARNVIEPYWDDEALERDLIARCILPKLPIERQTTYLNRPVHKQNFYGLVFVLQSALVRCHFEAAKVAEAKEAKNQAKSGLGGRGAPQPKRKIRDCFYCESTEHIIWSCPHIGQLERMKIEPLVVNRAEELAHLLPPITPLAPPAQSEEQKINRRLRNILASVNLQLKNGNVKLATERVTELADSVNRLPAHLGDLSNTWSDKVAQLLGDIANLEVPVSSVDEKTSCPQIGVFFTPKATQKTDLSKEAIGRKLTDAYGRFPTINSGAHPKLGAFLLLTAKAFKLTKPFSRVDPLFPAAMYDLALGKLSTAMQGRFKATIQPRKKLLIELLSFLARESESTFALQEADTTAYCHFCKKKGHDARSCLRLPNRLCFCCFQKGHDWKRCNNTPLTPSDLMNSI